MENIKGSDFIFILSINYIIAGTKYCKLEVELTAKASVNPLNWEKRTLHLKIKRTLCLFTDNQWWKKRNYLSAKRSSSLLNEVKSKHIGKSYYLSCLLPYSFRTKNERDWHKFFYINHNFCEVVLP